MLVHNDCYIHGFFFLKKHSIFIFPKISCESVQIFINTTLSHWWFYEDKLPLEFQRVLINCERCNHFKRFWPPLQISMCINAFTTVYLLVFMIKINFFDRLYYLLLWTAGVDHIFFGFEKRDFLWIYWKSIIKDRTLYIFKQSIILFVLKKKTV